MQAGRLKKPHIRLLPMFENVKTFEQVKEMADKLNGPIPQKRHGAKGLVRRMAHLDNAEKGQYPVPGIIGHGGADVGALLKPSGSERCQLVAEMMDFAREHGLVEFEDLLAYARQERFDDRLSLPCGRSAYILGALLKPRRHRGELPVKAIKVNKQGEIVPAKQGGAADRRRGTQPQALGERACPTGDGSAPFASAAALAMLVVLRFFDVRPQRIRLPFFCCDGLPVRRGRERVSRYIMVLRDYAGGGDMQKRSKDEDERLATYEVIGAVFGLLFGVIFDNIGMGLVLGVGFGAAVGVAIGASRKLKK